MKPLQQIFFPGDTLKGWKAKIDFKLILSAERQ
jgi:hypothetical protein